MPDSYLEKCIRALPPEKQTAARAAIQAIAETGDDSLLSKLLVTFEATAAYAETIPETMVRFGEKFLRDLDARETRSRERDQNAEAQREARLREIIAAQVPQLGKTLALDRVGAGLTAQTAELGRIERSLSRLRHARVGGMLVILTFGVVIGAGSVVALFWNPYNEAERAARFVSQLNAAGISAEITHDAGAAYLKIEGPTVRHGTAWRKNQAGYIYGADFVFPVEANR